MPSQNLLKSIAVPLAILVPTHRVLGSDELHEGSFGGMRMKMSLLDHERVGAEHYAQV